MIDLSDTKKSQDRRLPGKNKIEVNQKTQELIKDVSRGSKDDTVLLNINFKTMLVSYFRQKIYLKELTPIE